MVGPERGSARMDQRAQYRGGGSLAECCFNHHVMFFVSRHLLFRRTQMVFVRRGISHVETPEHNNSSFFEHG